MMGIPMHGGRLTRTDITTPEFGDQMGARSIGEFRQAADLEMQTTEVEEPKSMTTIWETLRESIHDMTVMDTILWGI